MENEKMKDGKGEEKADGLEDKLAVIQQFCPICEARTTQEFLKFPKRYNNTVAEYGCRDCGKSNYYKFTITNIE